MLRIVGGTWRGRRLEAPEGLAVRPTGDRTREALFNILESGKLAKDGGLSLLRDARVLDAFAGTGALGLEALSRGAARASFVESLAPAIEALKANIAALDADDRARVFTQDVLTLPRAGEAHDLVLMDPPYNQGFAAPALSRLAEAGWIAPGAIIVVEQMKDEDLEPPEGFELLEERRYGKAKLAFLRYAA
jgi:16S rRNA (guanine966-N2)-methyltransferase